MFSVCICAFICVYTCAGACVFVCLCVCVFVKAHVLSCLNHVLLFTVCPIRILQKTCSLVTLSLYAAGDEGFTKVWRH